MGNTKKMEYGECPIHKVAKTKMVSGNECQSCSFYKNCLADMSDDMEKEMLTVAGKYITEMQDAVKEHIVKKIKEVDEHSKSKKAAV